ncbi:MAG: methionyl-tRNA synthetase, partial [Limisphaerales bacterium]
DTKLLHFIGKDNIVFHCVIFPSILKAHGEFILPTNVPANEFMNMEGDKLSTSRNWAVWIPEYLEEFPDKVDVLRYMLCANAPETKDSEFTWKDWQTRNNSELVATFGNFVNRVMVLTSKYYDGKVPEADLTLMLDSGQAGEGKITYSDVINELTKRVGLVESDIEAYKFRDAQRAMMSVAEYGNGFLQFNEPWKRIKEDPDQVATVLFTALQIVEILSVVCEPFLPFTAQKIRDLINKPAEKTGGWENLIQKLNKPDGILLASGQQLGTAQLLFEKIPDETIEIKLAELAAIKETNDAAAAPTKAEFAPLKETIQFDDFAKMDLRAAVILEVEKVPKADKLLKLQVDLGFEQRTIVSGIATHFSLEELPGKRVVVLANLAPRKLRGVESQGMILLAEDQEGKLIFIGPEGEIPSGSMIS